MVRGQKERIQNGLTGDKRFEDEGGAECSISRGGLDCTVEVYMSEETEERVLVLRVETQKGGCSSKSKRCQESEFGEGKL